jgi:NAD(P)-dependent dehydrogenase (short-subunit alcohol dehydrogenase family)
MPGRLAGKIAIVTAAGQGIGRACAVRFAAEGAHVVVNDIRDDAAAAVVAEITAAGGAAAAFVADVGQSERVQAMIDETVARHGRLDVLLNNAAAPAFGRIEDMGDDLWRAVFAVTLDATFYGCRAGMRAMAKTGGSIINTASAAGLGGVAGLAAYGSAKAAVLNLTRTAAIEGAARKIRVNAVCPGSIDTPPFRMFADALPGGLGEFEKQIPIKRIGTPEESRFPSSASARRRKWRASRSSSRRTRRRTSPARSSSPTAASLPRSADRAYRTTG